MSEEEGNWMNSSGMLTQCDCKGLVTSAVQTFETAMNSGDLFNTISSIALLSNDYMMVRNHSKTSPKFASLRIHHMFILCKMNQIIHQTSPLL